MAEQSFHLIGIGGSGMSVLAQVLHQLGYPVSGSDRAESDTLERLRAEGIDAYAGHDPARLPAAAIVVVSSAIKDTNPELAAARGRGQHVWHRSQALAFAATGKRLIAVAGAHGKTTTSGMIAEVLVEAGADPSFVVGGVVSQFATGGHLGGGEPFVIEADESDGSFLNYRPDLAVITNIEPDHLDHYGSREAFEQAFVDFTELINPGGVLILDTDDPGARALAGQVHGPRVIGYGETPAPGKLPALRIAEVSLEPAATRARFTLPAGEVLDVTLRVPGRHNLHNAAAAVLVAQELGLDLRQAAAYLADFRGTSRRFELRGEAGGVRVFDDYGHHPTEVAATLTAARAVAGEGRVGVVFQPHLYSRTQNFAREFAAALEIADKAIVTKVYGAREEPRPGVEGDLITQQARALEFVPDMHAAGRELAAWAQPGDILLTVGAGSITQVAPTILEALEGR